MLRFGPDNAPADAPVVVMALPLFEEANRTRALAASIARALARLGVASAIPDLPGQGESLVPSEDARLEHWRAAFAAAVAATGPRAHVAAIRGGALIDTDAAPRSRWHFAPVAGADLFAELMRAFHIAALPARVDARLDAVPEGPPIEIQGNRLSRALLLALRDAAPEETGPRRTLRLAADRAAADRHIDAAPLWRRAEPGNDPALAALLADDIARWIGACGD